MAPVQGWQDEAFRNNNKKKAEEIQTDQSRILYYIKYF